MLRRLKELFIKEQFYPVFIGLFINPFYFSRRELNKVFSELLPLLGGRLLDVGCGTKPYELFTNASEYVGLEIDNDANRGNKKVDFFYDGKVMPFTDSSFDSVFTTQVLEHVESPDIFLGEIGRVLKKDGLLLLSVPFIWDEHEQPYDFLRYTSFGIKKRLEDNGFVVLDQRKTLMDARCLFQLWSTYFYKSYYIKNNFLRLFVTCLYASFFNCSGWIFSRILPRNNDFFLDNVVLAKRI